eukprot:SAG11_NODE_2800_length_2956_cov_1.535877_1_plen_169_part_00
MVYLNLSSLARVPRSWFLKKAAIRINHHFMGSLSELRALRGPSQRALLCITPRKQAGIPLIFRISNFAACIRQYGRASSVLQAGRQAVRRCWRSHINTRPLPSILTPSASSRRDGCGHAKIINIEDFFFNKKNLFRPAQAYSTFVGVCVFFLFFLIWKEGRIYHRYLV